MRQHSEQKSMLGRELEILMGERQKLLQVVGASAALIASLDSRQLPCAALEPADLVVTALNNLTEETLFDALTAVHAEIEEEERVVSH
ncbi:MAG TPA: hypothetical protein PKN13_07935 [Accumulibacter sp.]|nr:hypothetical protein [Accumulibacter sp.]HMW17762.1 hypothetical protein [Accumulibacter sp.]HMX22530.1 hypothetical protein [Accumulibacter sp.]HMY05649.1 hypothetical protein [Accumulibacter sp.]HNC17906.1 hypothetical protein [Accumulibacter sp.]